MRKEQVRAAAASGNVEDTNCILDLEKRRTVSTRPCTMGHGVRGHRRTDGVQARIRLAASVWSGIPTRAALSASTSCDEGAPTTVARRSPFGSALKCVPAAPRDDSVESRSYGRERKRARGWKQEYARVD